MSSKVLMGALVLSPLIGFLINGFRFNDKNCVRAGIIATIASGATFLITLALMGQLIDLPDGTTLRAHYFNWISVDGFNASASFLIDRVTIVMLLVITGVGSLIHLFSIGYMSHDERPAKYFAYLNLFLFNMLLLVLGDNLLVMFVGWEGVGLCSYLLIGFWFRDVEKANAGMKAFITNRIGDAGFLVGIFLLFITFGTIDFVELATLVPVNPETGWLSPITLACLFLFVGAIGKSAQIPLYVWLPDAMAGPTPVSALIHAATMVTAGVYMIIRLSAVYMAAPNAMMVVAIIGALTALFAATMGLTQWDIKKVLAYSTISQLGYMFLGVGVGAFGAALFHLMTHAFFKALMFLGSGSVIHAMDDEQDMRKMGGLWRHMPITHATFLLGWLAIIGMPPFAGFFSKDEILWYTYSSPIGSKFLWFIGVLAAVCTAFYMTRLMALTFWGKSRVPKKTHPHEAPLNMTLPLIILGLLSVVGGWVGIPHFLGAVLPGHPPNLFEHWLEVSLESVAISDPSVILEWSLMGISVALAGLGAWFAYDFYILHTDRPRLFADRLGPAYNIVANKYFVDEFYFKKIINPLVSVSKGLWLYVDVNFIDRATYVISDLIKSTGQSLRSLQGGNMQQYALYLALGLVATITLMLAG